MKKTIGFIAAAAAAITYAAYKISHEEPTEEERIIHEPQTEKEICETILDNAEKESVETKKEDDQFITKSFPNLNEEDIISITKESEENLKQIESLNDDERPIQHTVFFQNEIDLEEFKSIVISQGYVITSGEENELIVLHISKLDQDDILAKVFYLADLVKAHNGEYRGWIIK